MLPRIAIVYICAGLLTLKTTLKQQVIIIATLLFGYWFAMTLIPVPGEHEIGAVLLNTHDRNLAAWLDRAILGTNHTWSGSVTFDPEGPMSTIPAIATAMLGVIAGRWIVQKEKPLLERISGMFAVGAIGMMVGLMWNWAFPINKNLWTSSYVIFTAGMACVSIATIMWIVDYCNVKWWTKPFVIYGVNPIVAFVGSGVLARLIYTLWHVELPRPIRGAAGCDLPDRVSAVAAAEGGVAGVRFELCSAVVRDSYRALQAEYHFEGLTAELQKNGCELSEAQRLVVSSNALTYLGGVVAQALCFLCGSNRRRVVTNNCQLCL